MKPELHDFTHMAKTAVHGRRSRCFTARLLKAERVQAERVKAERVKAERVKVEREGRA